MRAVLSTSVPVERVAAFAEMAWMERRPELGLVCRAARSAGGRLAPATVQSVLPGLADAGAKNVVSWCVMLGLCDRQGGLTRVGEDVAATDDAPVPEQGVYALWLAEHPLIGRRVLSVERLTSKPDQRFEAIEPLPIEPDPGVVFRSVADPQYRFLIRAFPTNHGQAGCLRGKTQTSCRIRWTLDFDAGGEQWQLDGTVEVPATNGYSMRPMQHKPEKDGIDLWGLAETWALGPLAAFGRWEAKERRLAVSIATVTDAEQDTFRKTLKLVHVEVPGKGTWRDVVLEDVPVGPVNSEEASRWAQGRLGRHLIANRAYRSRAEVRRLFVELTDSTPLEGHSPTLPSHDTVLGAVRAQPEMFWSLAAPVDLAPRPVADEDLKPLRIGAPAREPVAEVPGVVHVPYRSGWSMKRLTDRLLAGAAPRRVLVCDRYVRGSENLASLDLLVRAFRAANPQVQIEVWTGDEEADFKQLQTLTGQSPRSYREVFGRSAPHDRFLLVLPQAGEGFGWNMSNSPLHARAEVAGASPDTPLRWQGLAAVRLSGEQLPERLGQWLAGGGR
jgi:hypothetical protein